ncbi:MAG: hypothetical protein SVM79_06320 [Chloroflexota bacterium]|nr:hypothetical protein [Chloroflexota bacterium]
MKQFLDGASSKLERKENGRFVALAQNNDADDTVRNILTKNAPGRGLARPENWGIAQVLWAPQGNLALGKLSGDLLADIRASLGTQVSGPSAGPVENRIEDIYLQIFTAGGKLKTGKEAPAIVNLREKLNEARNKRNTALSEQQQFEEAARRVEDLRVRRVQAKYDAESVTKTLQECRSQVESYTGLLSEKAQRGEKLKAAEAQHTEMKERIGQIRTARGELKVASESLKKLEEAAPLQAREVKDREKEAADSKAALEDARKGRQAVDDAREIAEQARSFLESSRALTDLKGQIQKITHAQETLASLKKERGDLVAPDAKGLRDIRKAIKERDECQVRIDASLITLEVVPETEGSLDVLSGENIGEVPLLPGTPTRIKGSPEVAVELPGVARLRAWGPTGSIEEHRKQRADAERRLKILTNPFNTDDLAELEALGEKAGALDKQVAEIGTHLQTLLSDRLLDDIRQERSRVEAARAKALESHPDWEKNPPNSEALKTKAQEINNAFVEKVEEAEARWEKVQSALTAATKQGAALEARLEAIKTQIKSTESRLAGLTTDSKSDEERETELKKIALAWEAAGAGLEEVEKGLLAYGDDPVPTVAKLERQLGAANETAGKALEDEKTEEGRLQNLSARGTYSTLALAEEEIADMETLIESEQLRVDAIRLIHDTVAQCRSEALSAVVGPVETAATRTMQRIAGERLGQLRLGESFEPDHVTPGISGSSVSIENVSGGEKEQIHLATRLALAEVLAREERQLVVLDDVLAATDAGRLARVMTILEESAQRLQVLILTCHPERYRGLEGANFIDLEAVVRGISTVIADN